MWDLKKDRGGLCRQGWFDKGIFCKVGVTNKIRFWEDTGLMGKVWQTSFQDYSFFWNKRRWWWWEKWVREGRIGGVGHLDEEEHPLGERVNLFYNLTIFCVMCRYKKSS